MVEVIAPGQVKIFTLFSIENFVNGSSSIGTLKKLSDRGVELYHLENLHAKLVVVPSKFVSIGSQNLTNRGHHNLETTVVSNDEKAVSKALLEIQDWISAATFIEPEDIRLAFEKVDKLQKQYQVLRNEAATIDTQIRNEKEKRAEERKIRRQQLEQIKREIEQKQQEDLLRTEREKQLQELRRLQLLRLSQNARLVPTAQQSVIGRVNEVRSGSGWLKTFQPNDRTANLLDWHVNGEKLTLQDKYRYPCIVTDTGKIGWIRVNKSRITFIGNSITWTNPIRLNGRRFKIVFWANWNGNSTQTSNITVVIHSMLEWVTSRFEIPCFFDLSGLTFEELPEAEHHEFVALNEWISSNPNDFLSIVRSRFLTPFKYTENLTGKEADALFQYNWNWKPNYRLRVSLLDGHPFLVAELE